MWYFTYFDHYYVTDRKKIWQRISEIFSIIWVGVETYSKQSMASLQKAYMRLCYYYIIQILSYFDYGWKNIAQKLWNIPIHKVHWSGCSGLYSVSQECHTTKRHVCCYTITDEHMTYTSVEFIIQRGQKIGWYFLPSIDGLVQERRNSIANALELRLSCTNPSISSSTLSHVLRVASLALGQPT